MTTKETSEKTPKSVTKNVKEREREAIALANQGRWEAAAQANADVLDANPNDLEALNRLGRSLSELGRYTEARRAFQKAMALSPSNPIAKKNLDRIAGLKDVKKQRKTAPGLAPKLFLEESGKTCLTELIVGASPQQLAKLAVGDAVQLRQEQRAVVVHTASGELLGRLPPRLTLRLTRLMNGGNRYVAAIASVAGKRLSLLIREEYQHPSLANVVSFPSSAEGIDYLQEAAGLEEEGEETLEEQAPEEEASEAAEEEADEERPRRKGAAPRVSDEPEEE
ncbi:MAG: tetratricopeptide repeat protein [Dehalococcoidia bacterium]|nr:tetratricopeptide repeat protein [Dehalococcoidia bacterium]